MKYIIAQIGGKQFKLAEGETFEIERQSSLNFKVVYFSDGEKILIGNPVLLNVVVKAEIIGEKKSKKISVGRFKAKSRYQKTKSHRQPMSIIKIDSINIKDEEVSMKDEVKIEEPKKRGRKSAKVAEIVSNKAQNTISKVRKVRKGEKVNGS